MTTMTTKTTKRRKTALRLVRDSAPPALEAGRLVSLLWGGDLTPEGRARLTELGGVWCPTCFAYQLTGHGCWTPEVVAGLREEARALAARDAAMSAIHGEALADDAALGESLEALGRALYLPDAEAPILPAGDPEAPPMPEGA